MLIDQKRKHRIRLLLAYGAVLIFGFSSGYPLPIFTLSLVVHLVWTQIQLGFLLDWLANPKSSTPEPLGLWGVIFDHLWSLFRNHRREIKSLSKSMKRIQKAVRRLSDGVVVVDKKGYINWWNDEAGRLLDLRPQQDMGQKLTNLLRDPSFRHFIEKDEIHSSFTMHLLSERERWLQFSINDYLAKERLIIIRDVTRIHQLERMREDFVSNASHELRTPLTVLQGYLETLIDHGDEFRPPVQKALEQMHSQSKRMANLVTDLLLLTKMDRVEAAEQAHEIDIARLLQEVERDAQPLAREKNQSLSLHIECEGLMNGVIGDLRSAFSNLVYNAINYTQAQGLIRMHWQEDEAEYLFSVVDNGVGIAPEHIPRLTERFYRVDSSRHRDAVGTGLGLAIVKHALQRHGGYLEILSVEGKGSHFICHLPKPTSVEPVGEQ